MSTPVRLFLVTFWVAAIAGTALVIGLLLGYASTATLVVAAAAGVMIGLPGAIGQAMHLHHAPPPDLAEGAEDEDPQAVTA